MATVSSNKVTFKNTFAPDCSNKELTVDMIIAGLKSTLFDIEELPKDVQQAVREELDRQFPEKSAK